MNNRLGRNDKCHCGSGKKYKHCHLRADEQQRPWNSGTDASHPPPSPNIRSFANHLQGLAATAPKHERAKYEKMLSQAAPILEYLDQKETIESASAALESHREEFTRLIEDRDAYLARAQQLFREEAFVPFRFSAADVRKAFRIARYVHSGILDGQAQRKILSAILRIANADRRRELSIGLLKLLPRYVAAGRLMDAWLIQSLACDTVEAEDKSNPFLFHMFAFGYDALMEERRNAEGEMLREIGLDPDRLQTMKIDEIEEWLEARSSDPTFRAQMEAVLESHPEQQAASIAHLQHLERKSMDLLTRDDSSSLLLARSEVENWLPVLSERWNEAVQSDASLGRKSLSKRTAKKAFDETVVPMLREMAEAIFTPERISELRSELKAYRDEHFAADDKETAALALSANTSLRDETEPAQNPFLLALCFVSLCRGTDELVPEETSANPSPGEGP